MPSSPFLGEVDVAIVGAGAAGIAAGRRILERRPETRVGVLEALDRVGGRARTIDVSSIGSSLDLGCGWLHGAETNPWTGIAERLGLTIDRTPAPWDVQYRDLGFSREDQASYKQAASAYYARMADAQQDPVDRSLGSVLTEGDRWNSHLNAVGNYVSGAELDEASIHDTANYRVHGSDWRVVEGYGRTVEHFSAGLPVALNTAVARIDHRGAETITLETQNGALRARMVIVTVSTNVLATGGIRFDPPLPDKISAAADLPLGLANKVFLQLDTPDELPKDGHLIGDPHAAATGAYHLRPFGRPVVEAYFGGKLARELEAAGEGAATNFALGELAALLGAGFRTRARLLVATAWGQVPTVLGSYAYARPGAAGSRAQLRAPVNERLFFAGEATSPDAFTTARGAYDSGVAAADQVLTTLRP